MRLRNVSRIHIDFHLFFTIKSYTVFPKMLIIIQGVYQMEIQRIICCPREGGGGVVVVVVVG